MKKRCDTYYMRFPEGRVKALTLSYDDGVEQDVRLIEIMKRYGIKGTFNLNSGCYALEGTVYPEGTIHRRMTRNQCIDVYKDSGMEVAVHGLTHAHLERLPGSICGYDILQDRVNLEHDFGTIVRGMAYPLGTYSDAVIEILRRCDIAYARTVKTTERFDIPSDWLKLSATCHHKNPRLMELAYNFVEEKFTFASLFYLWGHSYEFESDNNWHVIEEFAAYIGNREDIWYATNMEIYTYVTAYNQLVFSMDGCKVYNPTAITLYFETEKRLISVKAGETVIIY